MNRRHKIGIAAIGVVALSLIGSGLIHARNSDPASGVSIITAGPDQDRTSGSWTTLENECFPGRLPNPLPMDFRRDMVLPGDATFKDPCEVTGAGPCCKMAYQKGIYTCTFFINKYGAFNLTTTEGAKCSGAQQDPLGGALGRFGVTLQATQGHC